MQFLALTRLASVAFGLLLLVMNSASAEVLGSSVAVGGTANLWGAGHGSPPDPEETGAGVLPVQIALPPGVGRRFKFSDASGSVDYGACCAPSPPDGDAIASFVTAIWDGIAGPEIVRARHLAGVFVTDAEPSDPAPSGLVIDDVAFSEVSPGLHQIFFIGDGLTGEGAGATQGFYVPDSATRLFLGYMDCFFPCDVPGGYNDNSGAVSITVEMFNASPIPALSPWGIIVLAVGLCGAALSFARSRAPA